MDTPTAQLAAAAEVVLAELHPDTAERIEFFVNLASQVERERAAGKEASKKPDELLATAVSGDKNLRLWVIWIIAAAASLLAYRYLPENSHVVVGAIAGGIAGTLWMDNNHEH